MAALLAGALLAACDDELLPEGQEGVSTLCGPYRAVANAFPFDIPPDLSNPGENLRARDAIERLGFEVAALHDAVRISPETQASEAFGRYATAIDDALADAEEGTVGLDAPSDWLRYQDELNERERGARNELKDTLAGIGVDLEAECPR